MILSGTLLLFLGLSSQTLLVPPTYISLGLRGSQVANLDKTCMGRVGMHGAPHGAGWSSDGPKRRGNGKGTGGWAQGCLCRHCMGQNSKESKNFKVKPGFPFLSRMYLIM